MSNILSDSILSGCILPDNPIDIVAINDYYRNSENATGRGSSEDASEDATDPLESKRSGSSDGLWSLEQFSDAIRPYSYFSPTVFPSDWTPVEAMTQEKYSSRFYQKFPEFSQILPIRNVIIAGGAAAWCIGKLDKAAGDIDLFIVGINYKERAKLWGKVFEIVTAVRKAYKRFEIQEILSPGLISLICYTDRSVVFLKIQIILRAFPTIGKILHGFDISSCCVAYDGERTFMTALSVWSHVFQTNIVIPQYRSTTYEFRLCKYFKRGFAITFPYLNADVFERVAKDNKDNKDNKLVLPYITINLIKICGPIAIGTILLNDKYGAKSDYTQPMYAPYALHNFYQLTSVKKYFTIVGSISEYGYTYSTTYGDTHHGIYFEKIIENDPQVADVLPLDCFTAIIDNAARNAINDSILNLKQLRTVLKLTDEEILRFGAEYLLLQNSDQNKIINHVPALQHFVEKLKIAYLETPQIINWWIHSDDPSSQCTVSLNPIIEDASVWYGVDYTPAQVKQSDLVHENLISFMQFNFHVKTALKIYTDNVCSICLTNIEIGVPNTIILKCGHMFHWSLQEGCSGLIRWHHSAEDNTCPVCRDTDSGVSHIKSDMVEVVQCVTPAVVLDIKW